jgi:hypothetical protein
MKKIALLFFLICFYFSANAQPHYRPFFKTDSLQKVLPYFKPDIPVWPKSTGNVRFSKDTTYQALLKVWLIESDAYNIPIYGVYTDTLNIALPDWKAKKNYIMNTERYGPGKIFLFYFSDGLPLGRNDLNDLRKYGEIPGLR